MADLKKRGKKGKKKGKKKEKIGGGGGGGGKAYITAKTHIGRQLLISLNGDFSQY